MMGCAGAADYDIELPGGYSILRTSAHQVTIAPKTGETSWGAYKIPAKVTEVGWDEKYIIAKQINMVEDPKSDNGVEISDEQESFYWILNTENDVAIGPLSETDFSTKKEELGISQKVLFKKVKSIKTEK